MPPVNGDGAVAHEFHPLTAVMTKSMVPAVTGFGCWACGVIMNFSFYSGG
jgi:hypothetical protein